MGIRAATRRSIGAVFVVATAAVAVPLLAAAPANAEPVTIHSEGSVTVESFPSTKVIHLDKFDEAGGLLELTQVKVIASVSGELEGSVKNLSESLEKGLAGSIKASIVVNGPGVSDLAATGQNATSWGLSPQESRPLGLAGSDASGTTITDPTVLAQFVGEGALDYSVHSEVAVDINGPAPYKTTGVAGGEATVRVEYTYTDICSGNPNDPYCEPPCEPTITTISSQHDPYDECEPPACDATLRTDGDCEPPPTCETDPTMDGCEPPPTCQTSVSKDGCEPPPTCPTSFSNHGCEPEPSCESDPEMAGCQPASNQCRTVEGFKIDPVTAGEHGGKITITNVRQGFADGHDGQLFDWTSTDPILAITVKGGPVANTPQLYSYGPDGATSGTGLHAPLNDNSNKWYGLSHLCVQPAPVVDPPTSKIPPAPPASTATAPPAATDPADLPDGTEGREEPKKADGPEQPPAKTEKAPAPAQRGSEEPEPEPTPEATPKPKPAPPPPPQPRAPKPEPQPDQAAGDAPAAQ